MILVEVGELSLQNVHFLKEENNEMLKKPWTWLKIPLKKSILEPSYTRKGWKKDTTSNSNQEPSLKVTWY